MKEALILLSDITKESKLDSFIDRRGDYENEYIFAYSGDYVLAYSGDRLLSYSIVESEKRLEVFRNSVISRIINIMATISRTVSKKSVIKKMTILDCYVTKIIRRISKIDKELEG